MMRRIKSLLKEWPLFYFSLRKSYYSFWRVLETHILGTKLQECIWRTRHIYIGHRWTKGYSDSTCHPHRQLLVNKISFYAPLQSVLEIGCNTGPNLYLLSKNFPHTKLYGVDINCEAIKEGKAWLERAGIKNVLLSVGKADELECFDDKSIDCIFTDATVLCIGPDRINKVIREMRRVARKTLVYNEWHWENNSQHEKQWFWYNGHWVYNYRALLMNYFSPDLINISKHPKKLWGGTGGWGEFGAIIEVRL